MEHVHRFSVVGFLRLSYDPEMQTRWEHARFCMELHRAKELFQLKDNFVAEIRAHVKNTLQAHPQMAANFLNMSREKRYDFDSCRALIEIVLQHEFAHDYLLKNYASFTRHFDCQSLDCFLRLSADQAGQNHERECDIILTWLEDYISRHDLVTRKRAHLAWQGVSRPSVERRRQEARSLLLKRVRFHCLSPRYLLKLRGHRLLRPSETLEALEALGFWRSLIEDFDAFVPDHRRPGPHAMLEDYTSYVLSVPPMRRGISTWDVRFNRLPGELNCFAGIRGPCTMPLVRLEFDADDNSEAWSTRVSDCDVFEEPLLVTPGSMMRFKLDLTGPKGVFSVHTDSHEMVICPDVHSLRDSLGSHSDIFFPVIRCDRPDDFTLLSCRNSEHHLVWQNAQQGQGCSPRSCRDERSGKHAHAVK